MTTLTTTQYRAEMKSALYECSIKRLTFSEFMQIVADVKVANHD